MNFHKTHKLWIKILRQFVNYKDTVLIENDSLIINIFNYKLRITVNLPDDK